ncbi:methionine biosynthesis protein MetW [Aestuariirhabdus litorea]|uniref:Methionine biosynthesis protein MetW n=1 Tax=Aestuariirhabdus litorea TaxID=2528527 RepID=A0A3P3VPG2_9GAMM|nr:methionine biosynthesis protein MetW [Aestuariirhabdus litorea]RRJ82703.1 methionine biosynthesis protein MetW [Aestuariirhabdus litorea]RWW92863.1 methionine biosynthesis protein MetW [Endozoicomonadaceae bacterium GTF-13]
MRSDFECIQRWIKPNSRVLDLGCGDGTLLEYLSQTRSVQGYGLEINPHNIAQCVERGVNVVEQDLDKGLNNFSDRSFDTVVMTQALQAVHYPDLILDEMLRVGRECIVTFPNFGHWRCRAYLGWRGRMPVSKFMPYTWYNTPNIHFCTFKDFEALCFQKNLHILDRLVVDQTHQGHWLSKLSPNLFGEIAIYHLTR